MVLQIYFWEATIGNHTISLEIRNVSTICDKVCMFGNSNLIEALILLISMGLLNSQIQDMNSHIHIYKMPKGIWDAVISEFMWISVHILPFFL